MGQGLQRSVRCNLRPHGKSPASFLLSSAFLGRPKSEEEYGILNINSKWHLMTCRVQKEAGKSRSLFLYLPDISPEAISFQKVLTPMTAPRVFGDFFFVELYSQAGFAGNTKIAVFNIRNIDDDIIFPRHSVDVHAHDFDIRD